MKCPHNKNVGGFHKTVKCFVKSSFCSSGTANFIGVAISREKPGMDNPRPFYKCIRVDYASLAFFPLLPSGLLMKMNAMKATTVTSIIMKMVLM